MIKYILIYVTKYCIDIYLKFLLNPLLFKFLKIYLL